MADEGRKQMLGFRAGVRSTAQIVRGSLRGVGTYLWKNATDLARRVRREMKMPALPGTSLRKK